MVVELQKVELTRLLRDNARLNQRLDRLMDEIRHLHEMQHREQVLRQQDQGLRQQTQGMLERLTGRPATPPATPPGTSPATPPGAPPGPPGIPEEGAVSLVVSAPAGAATGAAAGAPGAEPEPPPVPDEIARSTPSALRDPPYASAGGETSGAESGVKSGTSPKATLSAAAKLAEILTVVGESLLAWDAVPARARGMPATLSPEAPPEAPAKASAEPAETRRPGTGETATEIGPAPRSGAAGARIPADRARPPDDEEGRLLEILGRMGPSAEDRRTAARLMKRLLRSRGASRPREPES